MKGIILIIFLFFGVGVWAQQEDNVFQKSEDQVTGSNVKDKVGNEIQKVGGPPGDDEVPIDNYLPVLIIAGVSLVVYQYKTRKRTIQ